MSASPQFQQPESLTKDRLKQELRKNGISFDQNENKDYYVRLYRNKILRGGGRRPRNEFSSDEEAVRRSPRSWGKKQLSKRASQETYTQMVVSMSDGEVAESLRAFGEEPGPIMDSTRGVYQRKLAKLMAERAKATSSVREADMIDYGTDQLGEWSSQSSEGEEEREEEEEEGIGEEEEAEEEEEEAGAGPEPPVSMRLRSRTSAVSGQTRSSNKSAQVAYVSYSTPTHHVESSYLLNKPQEKQQDKQAEPQPPQPGARDPRRKTKPPRPSPPESSKPPSTTSTSASVCSLGFLISFFLLVVMFAATFLVYDHYFNSGYFLSQGLDYLKEMGLLKQD